MSETLMAALLAVAEIVCFYLIGGLIPLRTKEGGRSAAETVCAGFVLYAAALELLALMFTWNAASLTSFIYVWTGCTSVLVSLPFVLGLDYIARNIRRIVSKPGIGLPELVIVLTAAAAAAYAALFPAVGNGTQTVSRIISDIGHDSLGLYAVGTGERIASMTPSVLLARFHMHGEFLAMLTGLDAEVIANYTGVMVTVFLCLLAFYRALIRLFSGNRMRAAVAVILIVGVNLFIRVPGAGAFMMFESGWTGDSIFVNVMLPLLILIAAACAQDPGKRAPYVLLFLSGIAACSLSGTAVLVYPFAMAAAMTAAAVRARKPAVLGHLILSLIIPCAALIFVLTVPQVMIG